MSSTASETGVKSNLRLRNGRFIINWAGPYQQCQVLKLPCELIQGSMSGFVCVFVSLCMQKNVCVHVCAVLCILMSVCEGVHKRVYLYRPLHVCVCVCVRVCVYVCIYIYWIIYIGYIGGLATTESWLYPIKSLWIVLEKTEGMVWLSCHIHS